jgi:tRNA G18 (ribose-2'-O)-methylase SpoU
MRKLTNLELRAVADRRGQARLNTRLSVIPTEAEESLHTKHKEIYVILDNIRSVYNIGAIFRTADAAGITKLYLCGICAHPPRPDLEKTALKTIPYVDWEYHASAKSLVESLKSKGVQIIALEQTDESIDYRKIKYDIPLAIIVGNEVDGVSQEVLDLSDKSIEIPMHGFANSLNVTTALGIVLFSMQD